MNVSFHTFTHSDASRLCEATGRMQLAWQTTKSFFFFRGCVYIREKNSS